jgi:hypothetical protein
MAEKFPYEDIINLPHHELTTRQRMPRINRAASFAPFAALTGYDDAVKEKARLTSERIELDEGTKEILNDKLRIALDKADEQPEISITYFLPDTRKSGGAYVTVNAVIKRIDEYERLVIFTDKSTIPIDDIYEIEGDIYNGLY